MPFPTLTEPEQEVLRKLLTSRALEFMIGAELEDVLTEAEDDILWNLITKLKEASDAPSK